MISGTMNLPKNTNCLLSKVIAPINGEDCDLEQQAFTSKGTLVNSAEFDGLDFNDAFDAIAAALEEKNLGSVTTNFRLRDWGVSRQRYWGSPIPMFNLGDGNDIPVPLEKLPGASA
jgi:leucyl-tRNA synthetase